MSKSKTLYVLLGVLLALCIAVFAVSRIETHKENIKNSDEVFLEIDPDNVSELSWEIDGSALSFTKNGDWVYDEDSAFPVDGSAIGELLETFRSFAASFIIEAPEDLGDYGLSDPEGKIFIKSGSRSYEILLGSYSTMDSERYVSIGDGNVYLVATDPVEVFGVGLSELILNDTVPYFTSVNSMSFEGDESYSFSFVSEGDSYCAEDNYFVENEPLDNDRVSEYIGTITSLSLTDYVSYTAGSDELSVYGLDSPELKVSVSYSIEGEEQAPFVFSLSRDPSAAEDDTEAGAFLRVGDSEIIYRISANDYSYLSQYTCNDLRHRDLVSCGAESVYKIEAKLDGKTYTIERSTNDDDASLWAYGDVTQSADNLDSALAALNIEIFADKVNASDEEIALTLYIDDETHPTLELRFLRYDGASCVAIQNGKTVGFIARSDVVGMIEAVNALVL